MSPITLQTSDLRAVIMPEAGASIASFDAVRNGTWQPLMRPSSEHAITTRDVSMLASFNLLPWSNRIVGAAFNFQGRHYVLRARNTPQGFAIHGDARERAWQVTSQSAGTLICALNSSDFADFNFPFPFSAQITYSLRDDAFDTSLSITNTGAQAMPAGFGFHPYFNRGFGASDRDEVQVQFTAAGVYPPLPGMAAQPIPLSAGTHQQPDGTFHADSRSHELRNAHPASAHAISITASAVGMGAPPLPTPPQASTWASNVMRPLDTSSCTHPQVNHSLPWSR